MTKQRALLLSIFRSELCRGQHRTAEELLALATVTGVIAKIITIPVTLAINYIGSKLFVFKK